ncbi:cytochrome P450 [Alkalihalobacterium alkalinitrilicum]|uniref:cytochrome P450 n=1 Tax=Alkalihalobacterium alkalinitrilicum TaxID=427920 RepID=UPI000994FE18|nr:cytochrome P450 [Alkalihalobacterium alkalinitrilicum]
MPIHDDLLAPEVVKNPYPYFHLLRTEDPVYWSDKWDGWILTRYHDINEALLNPGLTSQRIRPSKSMSKEKVLDMVSTFEILSKWMVFNDPPNHTRIRMLVNKAFTPKAVEEMRPFMYEVTDYLLDQVESAKKMDVIRDYAFVLPILVISKMLGLPDEDRGLLKQWSDDLLLLVFGAVKDSDRHERAQKGMQQMASYLGDVVNDRLKNPKDDLISSLVNAKEKGDALSKDEIIATCTLLVFGGHETTTNLIANGLLSLISNPEQLKLLKNNPSLIDTAIEELLRYDGPSKAIMRVAKKDVVINGKRIKEGQRLLLMQIAANRDPEVFDNEDELDITRKPNHHLGFGKGIHYCLGAPLARLEASVAINQVLKRFPTIRLETNDVEWQPIIISRALKSLPVLFD